MVYDVYPLGWPNETTHTPQEMRILMSGLKSEPGTFEASKLRMEMRTGEWDLSKKRLAVVRRKHTIAKKNMPASRKYIEPKLGDWLILSCGHRLPFPWPLSIRGCQECREKEFVSL